MTRLRPKAGTWFAVPLEPGYAAGLLARARAAIGFGYFFGPRTPSAPDLIGLTDSQPTAAILACRFTLGALRDGDWPVLGIAPDWTPSDWPIPLLCRFDELQGRHVLVRYGDDPSEPERELPMATGQIREQFPSDDCFGEGMLPTLLARLLGGHS
jgi:hypothetical protein